MALIFVALAAILLWFLVAPFLKPAPSMAPQAFDPRVICAVCDELRDPELTIERELGEGRFRTICGLCIAQMVADYHALHGALPAPDARADSSG